MEFELQLDAVGDCPEADDDVVEFVFGDKDTYVEQDPEDINEEDPVDDSAPLGAFEFEDGFERSECFADVDGTNYCVLGGECCCLETVVDCRYAAERHITNVEKKEDCHGNVENEKIGYNHP